VGKRIAEGETGAQLLVLEGRLWGGKKACKFLIGGKNRKGKGGMLEWGVGGGGGELVKNKTK